MAEKVWVLTTGYRREGENVQGAYSSKDEAMAAGEAIPDSDGNDWWCVYEVEVNAPAERRYVSNATWWSETHG